MILADFDPYEVVAELRTPAKAAKAAKAVHDSIGQGGCRHCSDLLASGVRVLACSCGYLAPRREVRINPRHLRYPIDYVRKNLPTLSAECREYFDYWLELELAAGHDQDTAERVTFARMVDDVLAPQKDLPTAKTAKRSNKDSARTPRQHSLPWDAGREEVITRAELHLAKFP